MTYGNTTNLTGLYDILEYTNTNTGGWFGIFILIIVGIVLLMAIIGSGRYKFNRALLAVMFVDFLIAAFLRVFHLLGNFPLLVTIMLLFLAMIWTTMDQPGY